MSSKALVLHNTVIQGDIMRTQQRVFLRGETYYYRRRVPQDLLHIYNKALIVFSLNTKDKKEAEPLGRIQDVKFDQEFEAHRKFGLHPLC